MQRISHSAYAKRLREASGEFKICWSYLCDFKAANLASNAQPLLDFQPRLAGALSSLSRMYADISHERNSLIERKHLLVKTWFAKRQKLLESRQHALNFAILTGKSLGDAFAFFFYRNDQSLLQKHLLEPSAKHLPTGMGGIGELEFVKGVKVINGLMILYHGITSFLRIGDLSLVDLSTSRIAGLAELKSWSPSSGKVEVTMNAIGPRLRPPGAIVQSQASDQSALGSLRLSASAKARLERQLKRIEASFKNEKNVDETARLRLESQNHLRSLDRLVRKARRNRFCFVKVDNGLALGAIRTSHKSFIYKATGKLGANVQIQSDELQAVALSMLDKSRTDNSLVIGTLAYHDDGAVTHLPGMAQLFWWDLSLESIRALMFHDVVVLTLFNSAHLFKGLERAGFQLLELSKGEYRISKQSGGRRMEIGGLSYYAHMIHDYLYSEAFVLRIIGDLERHIEEKGKGQVDAKIDLVFNQEISVRISRRRSNRSR